MPLRSTSNPLPHYTPPVSDAWQKRMARARDAIRNEAGDRVCGTCRYAVIFHGSGFCSRLQNWEGDSIAIKREDATACREWRA